jgi:hypothetical protein
VLDREGVKEHAILQIVLKEKYSEEKQIKFKRMDIWND